MTTRKTWMVNGGGLFAVAGAAVSVAAAAGFARPSQPQEPVEQTARPPHLFVPGDAVPTTLYATGEQLMTPSETLWRFVCGTDTAGLTADDLAGVAARMDAEFSDPDNYYVFDSTGGTRGAGLNVVFNIGSGVPPAALPALALAEAAIESRFGDASTVTVNVSFAPMGSGVLGATGSNYTSTNWTNSRNGLMNGMDTDDVLQDFLPSGSTIPVRYTGNSNTTTNEDRVFWTRANYRAAIGSIQSPDASMQFNTQFSWDYNPANGVSGYSFVDVVIHEVGHAMGFVSGADFRTNDMEALDVYRFANNDGSFDWNPDSNEEFRTTARVVDFNNISNDVVSDLITVIYHMSDGSPWQASHFREVSGNPIGIMDPAMGAGQTFFANNYFKQSDLDMFDAVGYDFPAGDCTVTITEHPQSQAVCSGGSVTFTVDATGSGLQYQWRKDGNILDGATGSTYELLFVLPLDGGVYDCVVSGGCGTATSNPATLTINEQVNITDHPDSRTVDAGQSVSFTVAATGGSPITYQWRKNGADIGGATSATYTIGVVEPSDAGVYSALVTNPCGSSPSGNATLTVNVSCPADMDGDGTLTLADFVSFRNLYVAGDLAADFDGSGTLTLNDFVAYRNAYTTGCP